MKAVRGAMLLAAFAAGMATGNGSASAGQAAMQTAGRSSQPVGHHELCSRIPAECATKSPELPPLELSPKLWAKMVSVNDRVNLRIVPRTDLELWGVEERWSYPRKGMGDCEDFVLEKRRQLMTAGFSPGHLLITVVRQRNGDGHAVLTVRTSQGDFILDNLEPRILRWTETSYTYLKRQSARHSGVWVRVNDGRADAVASVK